MNFRVVVFVLFGSFSFIICNPVDSCDLNDEKCLHKIAQKIYSSIPYSKLVQGDPALGMQSLDPVHDDVIEGKLSILKFTFTDAVTAGLKDCKVENLTFSAGITTSHFDLLCPKLFLKGKYEIHGRLIILPVEGSGDFSITSKTYRISVDADNKVAPGKDGKNYMSIKSFKQTSEPLASIEFDFKNLFNGRKDLANAVLKFANENWYEVAKEVSEPVMKSLCKKIIKNINKMLKTLPLEELQ